MSSEIIDDTQCHSELNFWHAYALDEFKTMNGPDHWSELVKDPFRAEIVFSRPSEGLEWAELHFHTPNTRSP